MWEHGNSEDNNDLISVSSQSKKKAENKHWQWLWAEICNTANSAWKIHTGPTRVPDALLGLTDVSSVGIWMMVLKSFVRFPSECSQQPWRAQHAVSCRAWGCSVVHVCCCLHWQTLVPIRLQQRSMALIAQRSTWAPLPWPPTLSSAG